jgi:hypothetical protein
MWCLITHQLPKGLRVGKVVMLGEKAEKLEMETERDDA